MKHKDTTYLSGLLRITNAATTPGTQPNNHNIKTINIDPQPLSITARGGKKILKSTLKKLINRYNRLMT